MGRSQRTIGEPVRLSGTTLFSGRPAAVRLMPAEVDTGFLFVRTDLPDDPVVPATVEALADGHRCTALSWNNVEVKVVEHVLSACVGLQVDNLIIEVDGDEMPALGGCPLEYAQALIDGGIVEQNEERPVLVLDQPLTQSQGDATIMAEPAEEGLTVTFVLDFPGGCRTTEALTVALDPGTFMKQLAPARTFGFQKDYEEFRRKAEQTGISDENTFVIFEDGSAKKPHSQEPAELRFADEAARHKIVDMLGDIALANLDLQARIVAIRSGHKLNTAFAGRLRRLMDEEAGLEEYLDVREIQRVLPHRYPFLMVDRILKVEENKIVGLKNISINEPVFQGHYPDFPIFPGVLQFEALAQAAGVLLLSKLEHTGKVALMVSMDGAKLRRPVRPGDQLILEAETIRIRARVAVIKARGTVNGEVACEAEMHFMLADADAI